MVSNAESVSMLWLNHACMLFVTGEPYLDDLNKPDVAETFKETMGDAKKVCPKYSLYDVFE